MPLCFVIGPIGSASSNERKHADLLLYSVLKPVLETEAFGYTVKRADHDADPGMIGDRIISDILNAELVVADLTDLNPNVFYELGIRHLAAKPTIHIGRSGTVLPFDTISHRTIFVDLMDWHSQEAARRSLEASVRAIQQPGYVVSNPVTQANASFKLRQSADPNEVLIAELRERVDQLEAASKPSSRVLVFGNQPTLAQAMEFEHGMKDLGVALADSDKLEAVVALQRMYPLLASSIAASIADSLLTRHFNQAAAEIAEATGVTRSAAKQIVEKLREHIPPF